MTSRSLALVLALLITSQEKALLAQDSYKRLAEELRAKYSSAGEGRTIDEIDNDPFIRSRSGFDPLVSLGSTLDVSLGRSAEFRNEIGKLEVQLREEQRRLAAVDFNSIFNRKQSTPADAETGADFLSVDSKVFDMVGGESIRHGGASVLSDVATMQEADAEFRANQEQIVRTSQSLDRLLVGYGESISAAAEARGELAEALRTSGEANPTFLGLPHEKDVVLVQFAPDARAADIEALFNEYSFEILDVIAEAGLFVLRVTPATYQRAKVTKNDEEAGLALRIVVEVLRDEPLVRAISRNLLLGGAVTPKPTSCRHQDKAGHFHAWDWCDSCPEPDGNYGQKLMRLPSAWNFLNTITARNNPKVKVGLIDAALLKHEDLSIDNLPVGYQGAPEHGNFVAGVLSATFDNDIGIDGTSPFVELLAPAPPPIISTQVQPGTVLAISNLLRLTFKLIYAADPPRVINFSHGYQWSQLGAAPRADPYVREEIVELGLFAQVVAEAAAEKGIIIVSAAGNDSSASNLVDAQYGNPFNWAAANGSESFPPAKNIIVVESVDRSRKRANSSNVHGHLSAPGEDILTLGGVSENAYTIESGTSLAAPQVTGIIALMYAYSPDLTMDRVLDILNTRSLATSVPAPPIDAFEALVASNPEALRDLADLNNDGTVNMRDFNLFKVALHNAEAGTSKYVFPREDLNGDGKLTRQGTRKVQGEALTDLGVMMKVWAEPSVPAAALPGLLDSTQ